MWRIFVLVFAMYLQLCNLQVTISLRLGAIGHRANPSHQRIRHMVERPERPPRARKDSGANRPLEEGNPGKTRSVGAGVVEMKMDFGPGYRVYFVQRGDVVIVLLCGGDKSMQDNDIKRAKALAGL